MADWERDWRRDRESSDWEESRRREPREQRETGARERFRQPEWRTHGRRGDEWGFEQWRPEYRDRPDWESERQRREEGRRDQPWYGENRTEIGRDRPSEYTGQGDWGPQGRWGAFGNRSSWRDERDWDTRDWERRGSGIFRNEPSRSYTGGTGSYGGGMGAQMETGRFAGRGPKNWRRSDERIREEINERLTDHPDIDASEIEVQVKNAEVTLTGSVEDRPAKRLAEDIAEHVSGAKEVHNQLRVQPAHTGSTTETR